MKKYLFDTSAIIAHVRSEPGAAHAQALFEESGAVVLVPAVVLPELETVLASKGIDRAGRESILAAYSGALADVVPIDRSAALAAVHLRRHSVHRLPCIDTLIAGCAVANSAILVHRDSHFDVIPGRDLEAIKLSDGDAGTSIDVPSVVKEGSVGYKTGTTKKKERKRK